MAVRENTAFEVRGDGQLPAAALLRRLYGDWRAAVARRSGAGELRASAEEWDTLQRFTDALAACSESERAIWAEERKAIDAAAEGACGCGHPLTHHDPAGNCFHVVGCSTGCDCR